MKAFRLILTGFTLIFLCWVSVFAQNPDRFTVDPNQTWQGTGVYVNIGDVIEFTASGTICSDALCTDFHDPEGCCVEDPDPCANRTIAGSGFLVEGVWKYSLVGKIGKGAGFFVGKNNLITTANSGELYLAFNDEVAFYSDNSGSYDVVLQMTSSLPETYEFVTMWGSCGSGDYQFGVDLGPRGLVVDEAGNLYVADYGNRKIKVFSTSGTFKHSFYSSYVSDIDYANGHLYFTKPSGYACKYTVTGTKVWEKYFSAPGWNLNGICVDSDGNIHVCNSYYSKVHKLDPNTGNLIKEYSVPEGSWQIASDNSGHVYIASGSGPVQRFTNDGVYDNSRLNLPSEERAGGIDVDDHGNIFIGTANYKMRKYDSNWNLLAEWGVQGSGEGQFSGVGGVAVDNQGYVYLSDGGGANCAGMNRRIQVFKLTEHIGPWLKITDFIVNGTPYVGQETELIVVVTNTGDQSLSDCQGIEFSLLVNEVDICGYRTPDSYLCSEGFLEEVNKSVERYDATDDLRDLDPGEEVWIPIRTIFTNFSGYTDALKITLLDNDPACIIRYEEKGIKYLKPFETQPNPDSYVNCLSTVLSGASSGIINVKAFKDAIKTVQVLSQLDKARKYKNKMMEEINKGKYGKAGEHAFHAFWPLVVIAGYAIPGNPLSFVDIAMYEFNAQGCAGLIANAKLMLRRFFVELLKQLEIETDLLEGLIGFVVACPTEIVVQDENGNVAFIDSGGNIVNDIDSSLAFYQPDIRAVLVPRGQDYSVAVACLDTGFFNFTILQPTLDSGLRVIYYESIYCNNPCKAFVDDFGVATSDFWLQIDSENDGTIDKQLRPTLVCRFQPGGITGRVSGWVESDIGGLHGVVVGLEDSLGYLVSAISTHTGGGFSFHSLPPGEYSVYAVAPIGFVISEEYRTVSLEPGWENILYFAATSPSTVPSQRSMGYWKHQVNVHLSGKGHAQESLADMSNYMSLIAEHFNNNLANPITIFEVPQPATQTDSLEVLQDLLTVKGSGTMNDRAKQQLIALMLNVVSLKLHQATSISEDSATVSQAITYCNQLISDSDPTNDEIAKDMADRINNGILVASEVVPLITPNIMYKGTEDQITQTPSLPEEFSLEQNYPNPFNPECEISYALPEDAEVTLSIYNVLGQKVKTLVDEYQPAGERFVKWDGTDDGGNKVASGIYFYRITMGDYTEAKKMILMK